jgi:hypothetical protein
MPHHPDLVTIPVTLSAKPPPTSARNAHCVGSEPSIQRELEGVLSSVPGVSADGQA